MNVQHFDPASDRSRRIAPPSRSSISSRLYKTTRAVDDISFRIARGSITGLLGGNGAGKTTTIAMIMGLVLPTSGRIRGARPPDAGRERRRCSAG